MDVGSKLSHFKLVVPDVELLVAAEYSGDVEIEIPLIRRLSYQSHRDLGMLVMI